MSNNEWITDRRPTWNDTNRGYVWQTTENGDVLPIWYIYIKLGMPWMPLKSPPAYVKPKRWAVRWNKYCYALFDNGVLVQIFPSLDNRHYLSLDRNVAKLIEELYNEARP